MIRSVRNTMPIQFSLALALVVAAGLSASFSCVPNDGIRPPSPSVPASLAPLTPTKTPQASRQGATAAETAHDVALRKQDAALVAGLRGQLLRISMPYSARLKRKITAWVYLPPDYAASQTRYPVAYILHGAPGGVRDCFVDAQVHRVLEKMLLARQVSPMILVGWDGDGPKGPEDVTYYLNRRDGYALEDFTVQELVPWVDKTFRTRANAQSRALIGFSAGGFGAANLGLKHPDLWKVLASHSGFFDPEDDAKVMRSILGPPGPAWQRNSPIVLARSIPYGSRLHFYMDVGQSDSLLSEFKKMEKELKARHVDFEARIYPGDHSWAFLTQHYQDSLRFTDTRWKEMAQQ
jgi:enterochelin esterase-like enzyme